ncbi:aldehyde dehydrogenase family protein [Arvimicrobium flavum]|uniref:aldehyde dehydrogenase family protein n=1 Tax=Arvimicrobium flavum TaxID=3393320 RepID=UPI00237BA01B|nr:aldehyde dehydrogenase family protein [Mesorhizobium shangrilense]
MTIEPLIHAFETPDPDGLPVCGSLLAEGWVAGDGRRTVVLDKYRLEPIAQVAATSAAQIARMIDAASGARASNSHSPHDRGRVLEEAARLVEAKADAFLAVMQAETGYATSDCRNEIARCVQTLRLSAEEARRLSGEMVPLAGAPGQGGRLGFTLRVPVGVVLAVTPFNAPLNTVAHKIGPALAAGNAVLLKPASQTPRTACLLAQCLDEAGLETGLLQVFHGGGEAVSTVLADPRVRFIAFTGSTEVGAKIQAQAGLRRTQMELGSIAFTVLCDDADLDYALPRVVAAAYRKAGQVCTSIQILLVDERIRAGVTERLAAMVAELPHGDPAAPGCFTGPMISLAEAERVERWIAAAVEAGGRLLAGGRREGAVVAPTLLAGVPRRADVSCREIFGPVMCIEGFSTIDEAIARVNATPYGLATGLFTNRLDTALQAARRLDVGGVHINETSSSRVDLMPYGGTKDSGFGREGPRAAIHEMTEERVISLALPQRLAGG